MSTAPTATTVIPIAGQDAPAFGALETPAALSEAEIEIRARDLLAQLTLDEKTAMMHGDPPFWLGLAAMLGGGYNKYFWIAGAIDRLGIPGIRFADGPRGIVHAGATTFPVSMARGATWDPDLEERVGDVIGRELRALGGNHFGGVCVNLLRHPAWGRAQETYGEDTCLLSAFAAALTRGVQRHAMACVKHYALNSMENARFTVDVTIDPRALHEVYLPHFKAAVDAGVASVMSAYNSVNGEWAGQNPVLLTEILKQQWGFDGFILTDFIWGMRDAKKAALAGQDVEMPFGNLYRRFLKELVEAGEVPVARIDDAALRLLRQQITFAQGRNPADYPRAIVGSAAHRQLAREAAHKSIVLLKNDANLLPLAPTARLAVIGRLAATPNTGDAGSSNTLPAEVVTPLQGIQAALGADVAVAYDDGSDPARAAQVAAAAEVAICVVGYTHLDEGEYVDPSVMQQLMAMFPPPSEAELPVVAALTQQMSGPRSQDNMAAGIGGDRTLLTLSPADEALIHAVVAANPNTVVAVMGGSAIITEAWRHQVPAIFMLWYPGMEGGHAFADLLFGRVTPSAKLPCTFPVSEADLPFYDKDATAITYDLWHGYRKLDRDGKPAAFPFGYGLSYTTFAYSNLRLATDRLDPAGVLEVSVDVSNTGSVPGDEVVQLYIATHGSQVERAVKELKAFARVSLAPGATRTVTLTVPAASLAWYEAASAAWVVEPLSCDAIVARHAADPDALVASFRIA